MTEVIATLIADLPEISPELILALMPVGAAGLVIAAMIVVAIIKFPGND